MESKITFSQLRDWLGSDTSRNTLIQHMLDLLNEEWPLEMARQEIIDFQDDLRVFMENNFK